LGGGTKAQKIKEFNLMAGEPTRARGGYRESHWSLVQKKRSRFKQTGKGKKKGRCMVTKGVNEIKITWGVRM